MAIAFVFAPLISVTPVIIAAIVTAAVANGSVSLTRAALVGVGVGVVFTIAGFLFISVVGALFFLTKTLVTNLLGLPDFFAASAFSVIQILQSALPAAVAGLIVAALAKQPVVNLRRGALIGGSYGVIAGVVTVLIQSAFFAAFSGPLADADFPSAVGYALPLIAVGAAFVANIVLGIVVIGFIRSRRPTGTAT